MYTTKYDDTLKIARSNYYSLYNYILNMNVLDVPDNLYQKAEKYRKIMSYYEGLQTEEIIKIIKKGCD